MIYRPLTKQRLCTECHWRLVVSTVKENMSSPLLRGRGVLVTVPIHPLAPLESLLVLEAAVEVERAMGGSVAAVALEGYERALEALPPTSRPDFLVLSWRNATRRSGALGSSPKSLEQLGLPGAWRRLRALYASVANELAGEKRAIGVLLLPACPEMLLVLSLSSFMRGEWAGLAEFTRSFVHPKLDVLIVNGLYGIPCYEAAALASMKYGLEAAELKLQALDGLDSQLARLVEEVTAGRSLEFLFSPRRTAEKIRELIGGACSLCGGPASSDPCLFCSQ